MDSSDRARTPLYVELGKAKWQLAIYYERCNVLPRPQLIRVLAQYARISRSIGFAERPHYFIWNVKRPGGCFARMESFAVKQKVSTEPTQYQAEKEARYWRESNPLILGDLCFG
jgi:hypothetical protein